MAPKLGNFQSKFNNIKAMKEKIDDIKFKTNILCFFLFTFISNFSNKCNYLK